MEPLLSRAASSIARPRSRTRAIDSATSRELAAANAVNSPTEWPTTKSGCSPRAFSAASTARLVATSAGCWTSVRTSSSSGASKHRRSRSSPEASLPLRKTSIASGTDSAISRPMPTSSEPCPGKQNATFMSQPFRLQSTRSRPSPKSGPRPSRSSARALPAAAAHRPLHRQVPAGSSRTTCCRTDRR